MYASQKRPEPGPDGADFPKLLDPALLRAARKIYRTYQEIHAARLQRPLGVVIDRLTYRGQMILSRKPILLPNESFVPFEQIESELY